MFHGINQPGAPLNQCSAFCIEHCAQQVSIPFHHLCVMITVKKYVFLFLQRRRLYVSFELSVHPFKMNNTKKIG